MYHLNSIKIMKNLFKSKRLHVNIGLFAIIMLFFFSCDEDFEELNQDPNVFNDPDIESMFSYSLITAAGGPGASLNYWVNDPLYYNCKVAGAYMQYFASLNTWQWTGDKYLKKPNYDDELFEGTYGTVLKEIEQLLALTSEDPSLTNHNAMTRIMRVYALHRVTDMYGDIPYFESGKGYLDQNYTPAYDSQSAIYADMLKELNESAQQLDASKPSLGPADFIFNGDTEKWKRFSYSLMLRLGMRLTKVDPGMAEEWVTRAITGGVMQSNEDTALLEHTEGTLMNVYQEGSELQGAEGVPRASEGYGYGKMAEAFVEHLKQTNDPRLPFYITLWPGNVDPAQLPTSTIPEDQKGLPNGYDESTIFQAIPDWTNDMLPEISEINLNTVASLSTPTIYQSYAEIKLLLAEAALRGWGPGDALTHYEEAVGASLGLATYYPGDMSFTQGQLNDYLLDNPYPSGGTFEEQMETIHTQFWISLFMNNIEVWSNYRRTGYPALTPTNYPGNETGGSIPRRVPYPGAELRLNASNVEAAIQAQGPDLFTTRIWWDVE